jgi:hypothetical protein
MQNYESLEVVKNRFRRWNRQMSVRSVYISVVILQGLIGVVIYNSLSIEELSLQFLANDGICQFVHLSFQRIFQ